MMTGKVEEKGSAEKDDYTQDGTVDLKGRPILRSNTGRWNACSFIVGYEAFERMAFSGISSNLVVYLTKKLHEGTVTSSNNVTNWIGTVYIQIRFVTRSTNAQGMSLLTLAVSVPSLRPPSCGPAIKEEMCNKHASTLQIGIFYFALYIIGVGTGGTKPNISTMGADQFDDFEPKERAQKFSFFNWWMFSIFFGALFAATVLVYVQDNVGWPLGYGLPTLGLAISVLVFLAGAPFYRHKMPSGSPFTRIAQVLVASTRKWKLPIPSDPKELYELSLEQYAESNKFRIDHSASLRFLDKAAVYIDSSSPWMLCPVTQVEETKQMVKMLPILAVTFIPSTMYAQVHTLFIKQGTTLDRSMGPHFDIPPASLIAFVTIFMLVSLVIYDRFFVPTIRRYTKNPRGITLLQRMGVGLVLHIIIMITACLAERRRLSIARENNIYSKFQTVPLTIFILLPQFALMGVADTFVEVAKLEFFYDQAPQGMKSLGTSYCTSSLGIGNFLSSFLLKTVSRITKEHGHKGWILDNLNISHLDYYYAFLAILTFLNFLVFLVVAKFFVYNEEVTFDKGKEAFPANSANHEAMAEG
ncbi:protein NRT1/ PTR FAMILY 5.2-like [Rhodamnia argentea]|uniref:Protein NRT1/ PTR FAMILY 5.2-like n=1 Tax=Rhodamnia argentea TaxID=178133 RepID=A0ABM3GSL5_9MYRT|nr:protein NRT1/ PTR FAMILY 5.2-like [Rhodamnia argentea]